MAYTLAQSITEVRNILNEDTPSYWSDTQITSWIQQGVLDFCTTSLLYMKEDTITLASGTTQYTTSTNSYIDNGIRTIHAVYDGRALQRVTYEQLHKHNARALGGSTSPNYYFDHYDGNTFTIYIGPTPGATEDTNTLTVYLASRTDDITDLPWEYQPSIWDFAAHKAKFRERQYQESYLYYQKYTNNIAFLRQDGIQRGIQPVDSFRVK